MWTSGAPVSQRHGTGQNMCEAGVAAFEQCHE
jgi:hypothetical protein